MCSEILKLNHSVKRFLVDINANRKKKYKHKVNNGCDDPKQTPHEPLSPTRTLIVIKTGLF